MGCKQGFALKADQLGNEAEVGHQAGPSSHCFHHLIHQALTWLQEGPDKLVSGYFCHCASFLLDLRSEVRDVYFN